MSYTYQNPLISNIDDSQSQMYQNFFNNSYYNPNYVYKNNNPYNFCPEYSYRKNKKFLQFHNKKNFFYKKKYDKFSNYSKKEEENTPSKNRYNKKNEFRRGSLDTASSSNVSNLSFLSSNTDKESENEENNDSKIQDKKDEKSSEENKKELNNNKTNAKDGDYSGNPELENTEILRVEVKISKDKTALFILKRFDDIFETIKLFCEINNVNEKMIKPLIIKSLSTLNTIYQIMKSEMNEKQIKYLQVIKKQKNEKKI